MARTPAPPQVAAVVLAAGQSSRMETNKLLADLAGRPVIRRTVNVALSSQATEVVVVTGGIDAWEVEGVLSDLPVRFVRNDDAEDGMSTSLRCGLNALSDHAAGALICLGDMPLVTSKELNALISVFQPTIGFDICTLIHAGQRGNPVLWGRLYFPALTALMGDQGGRDLLAWNRHRTATMITTNDGVFRDIDTEEDLLAANQKLLDWSAPESHLSEGYLP